MDYNNYYPVQSGHPPTNQPHGGGPQMQHQQQQPPPQQGGQMMHSPAPQQHQQNARAAMPSGPPNHHQQMQQMQSQQQQHIVHHPQQHPNYQQVQPPHPHGPGSHSNSPHPQPQQHHNHNHQPNMPGQMPPQQALSQQHVHPQSPHHHHGGPPMHIQHQHPQHQQQQQQQSQHQPLNQMIRPQMGPSVINQHPHSGPQPSPGHHHMQHRQQSNFYPSSGGPMPQSNLHHYPPNQHHHPHHAPQQHHPPPVMHHAPPQMHPHPHSHLQPPPPGFGRTSPYYPNILQTEFRIIELNRRLQCRPIPRHPFNSLPSPYDESIWWERFASDFFEDDATLTVRMLDDKPVEYTIGRTLIPRFFRSYFDGGVIDLSISLRTPKETCINPHMITLDCDQAFIVTNNIFKHPSIVNNQGGGVVVHTEGHLTLDFVSNSFDNLFIKSWRFYTRSNKEFIDRSILSNMGLPNNFLVEPITRQGFTKSTITYLKMCMIMEPMQELMFQHKQTKLDPRSCLRKLLFERYKYRSGEDNRAATNKRRKRKPSAAPAISGNTATTNKKAKAGLNNAMGNNVGSGANLNNMIMSPSGGPPGFSLASQDVMVVGEPSMMGGDFGDDNERMITRLENTQYDPTASTPSNEEDSLTATAGPDITNVRDEVDSSIMESHAASPSMMMQQQQQQHQMPQLQANQAETQSQQQQQQQQHHHQMPQHSSPPQEQQQQLQTANLTQSPQRSAEDPTNPMIDHHEQEHQQEPTDEQQPQQLSESLLTATAPTKIREDIIQNDLELNNPGQQENLIEEQHREEQQNQQDQDTNHLSAEVKQETLEQNGQVTAQLASSTEDHEQEQEHQPTAISDPDQNLEDSKALDAVGEGVQDNVSEETNMNSISNPKVDANMKHNISPVEQTENHTDSVQTLNDESNSNSQLPCSNANAKTAMEQQQPVDNGVA